MLQISSESYIPTLASRNSNVCPRISNYVASIKAANEKPLHSQRRTAQNHLPGRRPDEEQNRRRQQYLSKVRQASDDKKWKLRSEQILRNDFLSRQKQWELEQARSAPEASPASEDEGGEDSGLTEVEVEMVDRILPPEFQDFGEYVSSMQRQSQTNDDSNMSVYGSDEEDYDRLFMKIISREKLTEDNRASSGITNLEDRGMDTSLG